MAVVHVGQDFNYPLCSLPFAAAIFRQISQAKDPLHDIKRGQSDTLQESAPEIAAAERNLTVGGLTRAHSDIFMGDSKVSHASIFPWVCHVRCSRPGPPRNCPATEANYVSASLSGWSFLHVTCIPSQTFWHGRRRSGNAPQRCETKDPGRRPAVPNLTASSECFHVTAPTTSQGKLGDARSARNTRVTPPTRRHLVEPTVDHFSCVTCCLPPLRSCGGVAR